MPRRVDFGLCMPSVFLRNGIGIPSEFHLSKKKGVLHALRVQFENPSQLCWITDVNTELIFIINDRVTAYFLIIKEIRGH